MSPNELAFEHVAEILGDEDDAVRAQGHPGVVQALFADGSVDAMPRSTSPELLESLVTASGGETLEQPD